MLSSGYCMPITLPAAMGTCIRPAQATATISVNIIIVTSNLTQWATKINGGHKYGRKMKMC